MTQQPGWAGKSVPEASWTGGAGRDAAAARIEQSCSAFHAAKFAQLTCFCLFRWVNLHGGETKISTGSDMPVEGPLSAISANRQDKSLSRTKAKSESLPGNASVLAQHLNNPEAKFEKKQALSPLPRQPLVIIMNREWLLSAE